MATYQTEKKEQRLMININLGQKYCLGFRNGQFLLNFFLNIFLAYLVLVVKEIDIASYAGENTPFIVEENIKNVTTSIEEIFSTSFD